MLLKSLRVGITVPWRRDGCELGGRDVAGHVGGAMATEAHCRHDKSEVGAVAAHDGDIRLARQNLRNLADARGRFLMNDVVRVLEDSQQALPVQIALHARRIVVDAEREICCVGDIEEKSLDVRLGRADIGGRCQDSAIGAVFLGKPHILDRRRSIVAGCAKEEQACAPPSSWQFPR